MKTKYLSVLIHIRIKQGWHSHTCLSPSVIVLLTFPRWCFLWILFDICVLCNAALSVPCILVVTCWERADLLTFLYVLFSCAFVSFACGVLGQVWYLIVSIPDLCLLPTLSAGNKASRNADIEQDAKLKSIRFINSMNKQHNFLIKYN